MQISNDSAISALAYQQNQPAETTPQTASINTLQNATISLSQAAKVSGGAESMRGGVTGGVEPMRGGGVIITGAEPMRGGGVIITGAEPMRGGGVIITDSEPMRGGGVIIT